MKFVVNILSLNLLILVYIFFQDENNVIYPLLLVGFGSNEKVTDPDLAGQKSSDPDPHPWLKS